MSVFILKLFAIVSMFLDHLTDVMMISGHLHSAKLYYLGRSIGRPAFVIFCYLLVNGFDRTKDRSRYLKRLVLFALVSQIPYTLAFSDANYSGGAETLFSVDPLPALAMLLPLGVYYLYVSGRKAEPSLPVLAAALAIAPMQLCVRGIWLLDSSSLDVFYTLAVAMALMMFLEWLLSGNRSVPKAVLITAAFAAELYFVQQNADYGLLGVALILGLYFCRQNKPLQLLVIAIWCVIEYRWAWFYLVGALSALLPVLLYNGKLGPKLRTAFYVFYPAHLALLGTVFNWLSRN